MKSVNQRIADELNVRLEQVAATVGLIDGGATVPFIARYRKEVTGALDDAQLRLLDERLVYIRELDARRTAILDSIREQGKLDPIIEKSLYDADTKARLEDIYLPFKPKRRSKALIAMEAGLAPLADMLFTDPRRIPLEEASAFVNADKAVASAQEALDGARAILVERFCEQPDLIGALREQYWTSGQIIAKVRPGKEAAGAKFSDYFDLAQPLTKLRGHRVLALFRGEKEEFLDLKLEAEPETDSKPGLPGAYERKIAHQEAL